jgi:hypothetical protein
MYDNKPVKACLNGEPTYEGMGNGKNGLLFTLLILVCLCPVSGQQNPVWLDADTGNEMGGT